MRRPVDIARDESLTATLAELTGAFEGIAAMRIAEIKNQVLESTQFFNDLWAIYSQIRVGNIFGFGRSESEQQIDKELLIIITAEGGLSGDIDKKLVDLMVTSYDKTKNDVIAIGRHGLTMLGQRGVDVLKFYHLPVKDRDINVLPIVEQVKKYRATKVYYQEYVSLMIQDVKRIDLSSAVKEKAGAVKPEDVINERTYIFEPSTYAVVAHLERSMTQIAISQLILDSKLAQYASRFRAMSASHSRADETKADLNLEFNRTKRYLKDTRLKEIVNGLKKAQHEVVS